VDIWYNYCEELSVIELKDLETMHFETYADINYFYHLHMRKSILKSCHVFLKLYVSSELLRLWTQSIIQNFKN
jgi:hypothetical protein